MKMNEINIRQLDISSLMIFRDLVRLRKTTLVADRMGLSQSAISHALNRLRGALNDPLFVRHAKGMEPTAVALELAPKIEKIIEDLSLALKGTTTFDPAASNRVFNLAGNDFITSLLYPPLFERVRQVAPGVRISTRFAVGGNSLAALANNDIDLAIGRFYELPPGYSETHLFDEDFVVLARAGHPGIPGQLDLETYLALDHMLVSFVGGFKGVVDTALKTLQLKRHVISNTPLFLTACATVSESDLIVTMPGRLARKYAARFGLEVYAPPLSLPPFPVTAMRYRSTLKDPAIDWLLGEIQDIIAGTGPV